MPATTTKPLAGIGLAALLVLTACGGDSDSDAEVGDSNGEDLPDTDGEAHSVPESDGTYDFTPDTAAASGEEIRIEVPQELIDATQTYAEDRVLDAVTVRATDDAEGQCAIEMSYEYRDGAQEDIEENTWVRTRGNEQGTDMPAEERYAHALFPTTDDGWLEDRDIEDSFVNTVTLAEDRQNAVSEVDCAASPNDSETAVPIEFKDLNWIEGSYNIQRPDGTTEEGSLEDGTECAAVSDQEGSDTVVYCDQPEALPVALATAEVTVMASGEVHVVSSSVEGYDYEPNHGWIGEDQQVDSEGNVIDDSSD